MAILDFVLKALLWVTGRVVGAWPVIAALVGVVVSSLGTRRALRTLAIIAYPKCGKQFGRATAAARAAFRARRQEFRRLHPGIKLRMQAIWPVQCPSCKLDAEFDPDTLKFAISLDAETQLGLRHARPTWMKVAPDAADSRYDIALQLLREGRTVDFGDFGLSVANQLVRVFVIPPDSDLDPDRAASLAGAAGNKVDSLLQRADYAQLLEGLPRQIILARSDGGIIEDVLGYQTLDGEFIKYRATRPLE